MTSQSVFNNTATKQNGFTFLGLLGIVLVFALFSSMVFIVTSPSLSTQSVDVTMKRGAALEAAIRKYKINSSGSMPAHLSDLVTTTGVACAPDTDSMSSTYKQLKGWCGPYLDQPLASSADDYQTDGWGVNFNYNGINLKSCGPDRTCGNTDDLTFSNF